MEVYYHYFENGKKSIGKEDLVKKEEIVQKKGKERTGNKINSKDKRKVVGSKL